MSDTPEQPPNPEQPSVPGSGTDDTWDQGGPLMVSNPLMVASRPLPIAPPGSGPQDDDGPVDPFSDDPFADDDSPIRTQVRLMPVKVLIPAVWNYKLDSTPEQRAKLIASMERDGSAGVLAIRLLTAENHDIADEFGLYEVIDGNHRLDAVIEAGWSELFCEDFGPITLAQAITIARRRNYQWYEDDPARLGSLFREIVIPQMPLDELVGFMPDTAAELQGLMDLGKPFDWSGGDPGGGGDGGGGTTSESFSSFTVALPRDAYDVYQDVVKRLKAHLQSEGHVISDKPAVAHGQIVEMLCAEYLAGTPYEVPQ